MAQRTCGDNVGLALLANAIATGGALYVLILGLGPISGAHFNPIVSLIETAFRRLPRAQLPGYLIAQVGGAIAGVVVAHAMFNMDLVQHSRHARSTTGELVGEVVATFGLWLVIATASRARAAAVPAAVALYIVAAYWFTSSTSFANPAVTLANDVDDVNQYAATDRKNKRLNFSHVSTSYAVFCLKKKIKSKTRRTEN